MAGLRSFVADLHVHTVASACAEVEMIPPLIAQRAWELGLNLLGVADHHSVENVEAVQQAARPFNITILPGMEVQTREEVHILCLFDRMDAAWRWQEMIWAHLPSLPNREEFFGAQYVVDPEGRHVRTNGRLLQTSTDLSFEQVVRQADAWDGLAIPAHVDRPGFSLFANLGMIPPGVELAGVEISRQITAEEARRRFPPLRGLGLVQSGDAHRLEEMANATQLVLAEPTVAELRMALLGQEGRKVVLE
ncbi:MAG: PHP domain-containing protein [Anaerolineae bacterium]